MKNIFLLSPILMIVLTGCAGTAKTLSSSKVFAVSCPIRNLPTRQDPDLTVSGLFGDAAPKPEDIDVDGLHPRCSQKESVYSNAVWIPVLGPLFDLSTNTNPDRRGMWYFLSTALPIIGPAAQLSYGAKQCIAECMPRPNKVDDKELPAYFDRAMNVSDANCRTFLDRFYAGLNGANETKDTLTSISTITATGAAFANPLAGAIISGTKTILSDGITSYSANYLQGKLMPDLLSTIQDTRQSARAEILKSPVSVEEVVAKVNNYDALCSIENSVQFMQKAANNQNSGNKNTNEQDQKALQEKNGVSATPITVGEKAVNTKVTTPE
jgi:hypothetical protein